MRFLIAGHIPFGAQLNNLHAEVDLKDGTQYVMSSVSPA
jgi:hypothetical protein